MKNLCNSGVSNRILLRTNGKIFALLFAPVFAFSAITSSYAQDTTFRINVDKNGGQDPNGLRYAESRISDDGRFVAYTSSSSKLILGDDNGETDVFYLDRKTGDVQIISKNRRGEVGDKYSYLDDMSPDGRYVVFTSIASNLVSDFDLSRSIEKVYVFDTVENTLELVCKSTEGDLPNDNCWNGSISNDGRYVSFQSASSNLVNGDSNGTYDVFVHDRLTGETSMDNLYSDDIISPEISGNGKFLVFDSSIDFTDSLDAGDWDVFIQNRETGGIVSASDGLEDLYNSMSGHFGRTDQYTARRAKVSDDGRFVVFNTFASLSTEPGIEYQHIVRYDTVTHESEFVDVNADSIPVGPSDFLKITGISNKGRYISFTSNKGHELDASLVEDGEPKTFIRDMESRYTVVASLSNDGEPVPVGGWGEPGGLSSNAGYVLFVSASDTVVDDDTNGLPDLFLHKMLDIGADGDELIESPLDDINLIDSPFNGL